mgnify:CR=1 FL=1
MLNFENIGEKFVEVVHSKMWRELQVKYNMCDDIFVLGHGGNMAVADHTAIDMTRLSSGTLLQHHSLTIWVLINGWSLGYSKGLLPELNRK